MAGILIVRPDMRLHYEDLVECQQTISKMLKDGVVVVQPGFEVSYINTDDPDEDTKVGFE